MRRLIAATVAVFIFVSLLPGIAAADTRVGGSVVVEDGERVGDLSATGGEIIVRGTVDGDLRAYGSSVTIAEGGEVTGIVRAYGGDVEIDGAVGGNVLAYAGSVTLGDSGTVERSFGAVAGSVTIAGTVGNDANVVAGSVTLAETADVGENLNYAGSLDDQGGTVGGATQSVDDLSLGPPAEPLLIAFGVLMFFADLLLGAILLKLAPNFADAATETVVTDPLRTGGVGLAAVVGIALGIVLFAITIVGIPIAVAVLLLAIVGVWVASVYGQYVAGAWVLSFTDVDNRYLALVVGVVGVTLVGLLPFVGPLVGAVVFLLGAGVVVFGIRAAYEIIQRGGGLTAV